MRQIVVGRWAVGRGIAGAIMSLINNRGLQLDCAVVVHESLLILFRSKTMIWKKKEKSRIRTLQIDNL